MSSPLFNVYATLAIVAVGLAGAHGLNHCQLHLFETSPNSTQMQFTKEPVSQEYAILGEFKSLHCCAKSYRSIEWFKNGKPYPWARDTNPMILNPDAENQTIYTRHASPSDVGNYTCVLWNGTHKSEHHIELNVQTNFDDIPLATFRPHDQFIKQNSSARLYCEAFIGRVKLPDARSFISWYQVFDGQEQKVDGIQEVVTREDNQIVGAYLRISSMKSQHYGRYLCRIEIGNQANRLEMSAWIFGSPIKANHNLIAPLVLALVAAVTTVGLLFLGKYLLAWYVIWHKRELHQCQALAAQNAEESRRFRTV